MQKVLYTAGLLLLMLSCDKTVSEFQSFNFMKYFGSGMGSLGSEAVELSDGGFIVTGYDITSQMRRQIFTVRTDREGNTLWQRLYGTEHNEEGRVISISGDELFIAVNKTSFITGITESFILKLNLQGDSIASFPVISENNIVINDMAIGNDNIYVAGEVYQSAPSFSKYMVACLNRSGELLWKRTTGTFDSRQTHHRVFLKDDGNILLAGINNEVIGSDLAHISVMELNPAGIPIGGINLDAETDQLFGNAYLHGDDLFVLHSSIQGDGTISYITSVSAGNRVAWISTPGISETGTSLIMTGDNEFIATTEGDDVVIFHSLTVSGAGNGEITELKEFPGSVGSIIYTSDGGILATGSTSAVYGTMVRLIKTGPDLYLLKP